MDCNINYFCKIKSNSGTNDTGIKTKHPHNTRVASGIATRFDNKNNNGNW